MKTFFSVLMLGALISGCQESTEEVNKQPLTSTEKQQDNQQEIPQEQNQAPVERTSKEPAVIEAPEPAPKPKVVVKTPVPVVISVQEKPSKPLDMTLDHETTETIRMDVPQIMDRPMELPDLFGKYEKQVKIKSRVLGGQEGKALDKVDGAEINVEMKVR